jgi:hypothetical protein
MSPDADARIRALEAQRQALDRDIKELRAGVVVQPSESEANLNELEVNSEETIPQNRLTAFSRPENA